MFETYRKALQVLVLNRALQSYSFNSIHALEAGICIYSSRWMLRLRTLQEAALPDQLRFGFRDRAVELDNMHSLMSKKAQADEDSFSWAGVLQDYRMKKIEIRSFSGRAPSEPQTYDVQALANAVRSRSLSKPRDEAIYLANLLRPDSDSSDYAATQIVDPSASNTVAIPTMEGFWQLCDQKNMVPSWIIFQISKRLESPRYGWAPSTLLHQKFFSGHPPYQSGTFNEFGLLGQFSGFELEGPPARHTVRASLDIHAA